MNFLFFVTANASMESPSLSEIDDLSSGNFSLDEDDADDFAGLSGTKKFGIRGPGKKKQFFKFSCSIIYVRKRFKLVSAYDIILTSINMFPFMSRVSQWEYPFILMQ